MDYKYDITVFTPTYNRAYIIDNLYNSLVKQTVIDFEWIIVNQGNDETEEKVKRYIEEGLIKNIVYIKSEKRKGINRSYNDAVKVAKGRLFFKVDDDDYLAENALERLLYYDSTVTDKNMFAGVSALRGYNDGKVIGDAWASKNDYIDATNLERTKYKLNGDKAEAYYLDVVKKYGPLPEFENESLTFESFLYDDIANAGLKIRWFNEIIYFTEYLPDGQTRNTVNQLENNLITYGYMLNKTIEYKSKPTMWIIRNCCRYCEMCKRKKKGYVEAAKHFNNVRSKLMLRMCWIASVVTKYM